MEYIRWRGVISQQSLHIEPVLDDQYSSSEGHILVEFQYEIVQKWVIHGDDGGLLFVRSESHQEAGMTRKTHLDYGTTDEDLKQLLLEKLETYDLRFDQNSEEKLADEVIKHARKLGSTGQEKSSSLLVNIQKTLFYVMRGSVSQLGKISDGDGACEYGCNLIAAEERYGLQWGYMVCLEEISKGVEALTDPAPCQGVVARAGIRWNSSGKKMETAPTLIFWNLPSGSSSS